MDRHISLVDINKKDYIILDKSGLYANTPLMISANNYISNLTVIKEGLYNRRVKRNKESLYM